MSVTDSVVRVANHIWGVLQRARLRIQPDGKRTKRLIRAPPNLKRWLTPAVDQQAGPWPTARPAETHSECDAALGGAGR